MAARPERSDPTQHVELDLNSPAFLRSWFALEKDEKIRVLNASEKISQLTCTQLYRDAGLKWEEIARSPIPLPPKVGVVYSLRITQGRRAVACRDRHFIRLLWIAPDHDSTYSKSHK